METDRQAIERRDFPIARRGYDPSSVDRHLAALADTVDRLRSQQAAGGLAASTRELQTQIDAVGRELESLLASVRVGAARVAQRIAAVEASLPQALAASASAAPAAPAPPPAAEPKARLPLPLPPERTAPLPPLPPRRSERPADAAPAGRSLRRADTEGARLVALDLALSGVARGEVERYLASEYGAVDARAVLDAVYASID